jgi:mannose-6-phosphate isomerase-like protein (cupin superfamily)
VGGAAGPEGLQPKSGGNKIPTVFETKVLSPTADAVAPDGSDVRILLGLAGAGMAHFELRAGAVSVAVRHRTVEEIWYVLSGRGEMWRREAGEETTAELSPGVCLTIPLHTEFQFRSRGPEPLSVLGITVPPWPGDGEAIRSDGLWAASVEPGPGLVER